MLDLSICVLVLNFNRTECPSFQYTVPWEVLPGLNDNCHIKVQKLTVHVYVSDREGRLVRLVRHVSVFPGFSLIFRHATSCQCGSEVNGYNKVVEIRRYLAISEAFLFCAPVFLAQQVGFHSALYSSRYCWPNSFLYLLWAYPDPWYPLNPLFPLFTGC